MSRMEGGEVFILKMPRMRVGDLVEVLVEAYAPLFGFRTDEIAIQTIGARPGEKWHEVLLTDAEALMAEEVDGMYVLRAARQPRQPGRTVSGGRADEPLLDRAQVRELLDMAGWLRPERLPTLG
jgi:FlaA1/EpsC-like NDP-sugar epimerase